MTLLPERLGATRPYIRELDVVEHLDQRAENPAFIMVEFGHGGVPTAYKQPSFTGGRAYVGVENWLRDPWHRQRNHVIKLEAEHPGQNVSFITIASQGEMVRDEDGRERDVYYIGDYSAETVLSDECADEVFLSNDFCDPLIGWNQDRTDKLLAEAARIVSREGVVVVRETITPSYAKLGERVLAEVGLNVRRKLPHVTRFDHIWQQLEAVYDGEPWPRSLHPQSFYLFLAKTEA
jgi:hypothetical protein